MFFACAVAAALLPNMLSLQTRAVPSPRQLAWHQMETNGFIHFGPNTFTGQEWGKGTENPNLFNPTNLDCNQWVSAFKAAGMKGIILTAKHHDGFCLWPSQFSSHTVSQSPFKRDILKELSIACKKQGLKLGVYLSPWDRNHPNYGTEAYNDTFVNMLTEVLTNYGPIFEVWFDGANGEGPNGKRQVYDWNRYISTVRKLQPDAVIFSDAGPDVRWVGNEQGFAPETSWATINRSRYVPGTDLSSELGQGTPMGSDWVPSECDVSIRPGWFWRESENGKVKSGEDLENLYYRSVGHASTFLLNVPPDRRGLIHENDVKALADFGNRIRKTFSKPVVAASKSNLLADNTIEQNFGKATLFDCIELREDIASGQAIARFSVDARINDQWQRVASGTTIGSKRLIRMNPVTATAIRVKVEQSNGASALLPPRIFATPDCGKNFMHETKEQKDARMAWWREARFGMFIHWGLYSVPGGIWNGKDYGGAAEWLMNVAKIQTKDYEPLREQFNPVNFDAKKIVDAAKAAGMKYIVITSKHHDGFAIYPSKEGKWHIGNTQFKRDPLQELSDECRRQGVKFCTYHSIMDWHHPDFIPLEKHDTRSTAKADFERYVRYMKTQLKEIVTRYKPEVMWFDGEWKDSWNHKRGVDLYNFCRSLSPNMIINNRVDVGRNGMQGFSDSYFAGDFGTPEQEIPANGVASDWESCMTMNGSWGYAINDKNWKSSQVLIQNLVDCASKGGNYLLNIGPTGLGEVPTESVLNLVGVGNWLKINSEAVYGSQASPFEKAMPWGRVTRKGNTLYCAVFDPNAKSITLPGLRTRVTSATVLGSRERVEFVSTDRGPEFTTPAPTRVGPTVIKVGLSSAPRIDAVLQSQEANGELKLMAGDATVKGSARYEADKKCIGFWTNPLDTVTWGFEAVKTGEFKLTAEYACEPGSEGALVSVFCGDHEVQFTVKSTGSWSKFETVNLGTIKIKQIGAQQITVKARMMPKGAVMNLRSIQLK